MNRIRTLLVDDNENSLQSLRGSLLQVPEMEPIAVGHASSGEEAIRMAAELKPDLILMDLDMPGMGGLAATRAIKAGTEAPRIIVVTIHDGTEYEKAAIRSGADGFVSKSDVFQQLAPLVRALFKDVLESSSVRLLKFEVDGNGCVLYASIVERVISAAAVTPLPEAPNVVMGVIDWQGSVVPVINMRRRFHFKEHQMIQRDMFIIARIATKEPISGGHGVFALAVDIVHGVVETPALDITAADDFGGEIEHIEGVARLPGGLLLIHDLNLFLSVEVTRKLDNALQLAGEK
jgi:purine-binding chemotaxis protein CheW